MIYDTLKLTKALELAFPREQAEAVATALVGSTQETLVTKSDLDAAIARLQAETIKWVVGAIVLNVFGTAGLVVTLIKIIH